MSTSTPADRIPAKTDAAAKKRFLGVLQASLATVTNTAQWVVVPLTHRPGVFAAVTNPPAVKLRVAGNSGERLFLRSTLNFSYEADERFEGERKVCTHEYAHTVGDTESLSPQRYSWEWAADEPKYPHVHVDRKHNGAAGLGKMHIPTGRVFYEAVLMFLITDHNVEPARSDWDSTLSASLSRVAKYARWGGWQERHDPHAASPIDPT